MFVIHIIMLWFKHINDCVIAGYLFGEVRLTLNLEQHNQISSSLSPNGCLFQV